MKLKELFKPTAFAKVFRFLLEGRYTLVVTKPDGTSRVVADFPNLITNGGLDRIGDVSTSNADIITHAQVGTGTTAPAFTDSSLTTFLAASNTPAPTLDNAQTVASTAPYYAQITLNKRFEAGVATGNLSEVGVGWSSGANTLFSHARILDSGGSPTSITILADEVLDVLYTLRVYAPDTDVTATISGYSVTSRAAYVTTDSQWFARIFQSQTGAVYGTQTLGAVTGGLSESNGVDGDIAHAFVGTYTAGTYTRQGETNFALTKGNIAGGIGSMLIHAGFGSFQVKFDPKIPKDDTKILTISWAVSWARIP